MSDEIVEPEVEVESEVDIDENEPVFFKIKTLTLVASAARILSWEFWPVFSLFLLETSSTFLNYLRMPVLLN